MSDYDRLLEIAPPANTFAPGTTVPQNSVDEAAATMAREAQPPNDYDRLLQIAPPNADMDTMLTGMNLAKSAIGLATLPLSLPSPQVTPKTVPPTEGDAIAARLRQAYPNDTAPLKSDVSPDEAKFNDAVGKAVQAPIVSSEIARKIMSTTPVGMTMEAMAKFFPNEKIRQALEGGQQLGGDVASSMSSPMNLGLAATGGLGGKLGQTAMLAAFEAQAIKHAPEQWQAFKDAPDVTSKTRALGNLAVSLGLPLFGQAHVALAKATGVPVIPETPGPENPMARFGAENASRDANQQSAIAQMLRQRGNLPPVKGVTARFRGFEPGADPTSQANITRDILARNRPLQAEAQRLALQLKQAPGMAGRRIIQDRIDAINQEMASPPEVGGQQQSSPVVETTAKTARPDIAPEPPSKAIPVPSAEPPASEPTAQVGAEPTGMSNKSFAAVHGEGAVPSGQGRSPAEWKAIGDRRLLVDQVDPYAVLTKGRQQGNVLPPEDVALLGAEHRRLVADAKQSEGTPQWDQKSQFAADYARALQPFKTSASSVFHSLQETYEPTFDSLTDFDQHIRHRLGREMTPEEKTGFSQAASDVRESKNGATTEATAAVERVRKYRPKETMSFDEASKSLGEQISELTKDCIL